MSGTELGECQDTTTYRCGQRDNEAYCFVFKYQSWVLLITLH